VCTLIPTAFALPRELAPAAQRVAIVGSFNGWDATAHPLTKTPDGNWVITLYFPSGRIVYGFDVDGVFRTDPFDEDRMPNGRGSAYSFRYVRAHGDTTHRRVAAPAGAPPCRQDGEPAGCWGSPGERTRAYDVGVGVRG
jgi:hypothetical protein